MAFNSGNMTLAYGGGRGNTKRWVYMTTDTYSTVAADGYFDSFSDQISVGDIIDVSVVDVVTPATRGSLISAFILVVSSLS